MISVKGGGGENVRPETDEYTALLAEALTEIEGKAALGGNATAEDIREGKNAYVNGQLIEGLMKEGLIPENFGFTKMAVDTMFYSGAYTISNLTGSHSLGEIPKMILIRPKTSLKFTKPKELSFLMGRACIGKTNNLYVHMWYQENTSPDIDNLLTGGAAYSISTVTATNFRLPNSSVFEDYYFSAGVEYEVITWA